MTTRIGATELSRRLSDVLNRVRYRDESFLIERNGEPIAALGPATPPTANGVSLSDLIEALGRTEPLDDAFANDLEEIQSLQPRATDPAWPS